MQVQILPSTPNYRSNKMGDVHGKQLKIDKTEKYCLTHAEWNSMPEYFSRGSNETGIRFIKDGEVQREPFWLIQHGWHDYKLAGEIIKRLLNKKRNEYQIDAVLSRLAREQKR
jgi:hypothetical protein